MMMRKLYTFLLAVMAWNLTQAQENAFYFTDAILLKGSPAGIELCVRNTSTNLTCLEAEIRLPEGLSVVCGEDGIPAVTLYRFRSEAHEILANVLDNGNLKLLVSSVDGALFRGNEGAFLSFLVQAEEDAPTGEYPVETVGESLLVSNTAEAFYSVGVTGNVLITDNPTDLKDLKELKDLNDAIYNLAGQRLEKAKKGINIIGGKKILK